MWLLLLAISCSLAAPEATVPMAHVRSVSASANTLLTEATTRSPIVNQLVERLTGTDVIVYVEIVGSPEIPLARTKLVSGSAGARLLGGTRPGIVWRCWRMSCSMQWKSPRRRTSATTKESGVSTPGLDSPAESIASRLRPPGGSRCWPEENWRSGDDLGAAYRSYDSRREDADSLIKYLSGSAQKRSRSSRRLAAPP
jgi:hypothetical protein